MSQIFDIINKDSSFLCVGEFIYAMYLNLIDFNQVEFVFKSSFNEYDLGNYLSSVDSLFSRLQENNFKFTFLMMCDRSFVLHINDTITLRLQFEYIPSFPFVTGDLMFLKKYCILRSGNLYNYYFNDHSSIEVFDDNEKKEYLIRSIRS
jgi:hypothetical protein